MNKLPYEVWYDIASKYSKYQVYASILWGSLCSGRLSKIQEDSVRRRYRRFFKSAVLYRKLWIMLGGTHDVLDKWHEQLQERRMYANYHSYTSIR
jgi:hypothetical protein